ncbi:RimK/LysX family protein [Gilvimarinus sp. SDUM040013]|uniref:RimK/LysX family protein n=1 Tax=Gilvimarinus gilvus TaxID=3058038 RepID=A0ABU4RVE7_9GAMM|nr:RimK/LysX family protein [Gilvimarinus sp. SDUM040013]MDO3387710.1 RimK/LysX family protein [Gilvimarinus sp. SDUM040013]MDX6848849.1 RimK/LysX family protein [Gilvimarinus sp. SDUM040013]
MNLPKRVLTLGLITATLTACSNSHYQLVATEDLSQLHACAISADNQHQLLLQQQLELKQGMADLLTELEHSRSEVAELSATPQECISVSVMPETPQRGTDDVDEVAKQLVGANETVRFEEFGLALPATIDTGVSLSVLYVTDVQLFERNGEDWVGFAIDSATSLEKKLLRQALVTGQRDKKKPVVELRFTLGNVTQSAEFALTQTAMPRNPVRIGRMALRDVMVVDVSRDHIASNVDEAQ